MRTVFLVLAGCAICLAQSADDCKPSSLNIPGAKYPCVYPDHRATFHFTAPDAQKVQLKIAKGFDMTKDPDGTWTITTTPLVEGFHYYSVAVDGKAVADHVFRIRLG
jgi:1,4-alpha-glucan branching enzyme